VDQAMSQSEPTSTIDQAINSWLPAIDAELHGVPVPERCMRAAFMFMESIVLEVQGDNKADFFTKPWFKPIYQAILAWYRKHYGEAAKRRPNHLIGACDFLGAVFELLVPRTLSQVETEGEAAWLIFPNGLGESELASNWIARPPNLALLETEDRNVLLRDVEKVGCQLRTIFVNLMERDDDDVTNQLIRMVLPHLFGAASHLVEQPARNLALACWDAQQAVEKVLKALARQQFGNHRHIHDVNLLRDDVARSGLALPDNALLDSVPNDKRIVAIRAGEARIDLAEAYKIYRACLEATALCTAVAKRKYYFNNFRLLLRKPAFI
jgi:HEPN domain-containing protein